MKRCLFIFVCSIFYCTFLLGQKKDWGLELKYKHGFLIAHRPIMSQLSKEHTNAFEGTLNFQTDGTKNWHKAFKFPVLGLSVLYTNAGNKEVLGSYIGAFSFLRFRIISYKKSKLYTKIGTGIGYTNKIFNQLSNPKNVAVSSHINALINVGLFYQYEFENYYFNTGLDMTHFSNGATTLPNLGINLTYFTIGFGQKIENKHSKEEKASPLVSEWKYSAIGILSLRDSYPTGEKRFPVYSLSLKTQKAFRHGLGYETGLDLIYKPSIQKFKPVIPKSPETMLQLGWYNGYFVTLDHLQIHLGMGVYLKDEYFSDDRLYHRIGMRYCFNNGLLMNLTLKSHWAKADYVEYGIGYYF